MEASIRNSVHFVGPQKMPRNVVLLHRNGFLKCQQKAQECESHVPPAMERHTASMNLQSRLHHSTVQFTGDNKVDVSVASYNDGSFRRYVHFPHDHGEIPKCCGYTDIPEGFPCLHGVSVICEKFGSFKVRNLVEAGNCTQLWKRIYRDVTFSLPSQAGVDDVNSITKLSILSGDSLNIPKP